MRYCTVHSLLLLGLAWADVENVEVEEVATNLLQQKHRIHGTCGIEPGIHVVKIPKLQRQFALVMPHGLAQSPSGVPVFMFFHGVYQTPWFSINILGLPDMLELMGWIGILPFGQPLLNDTSMGGMRQCCSDFCDPEDDDCCLSAKNITSLEAWRSFCEGTS
eukprot:Skav205124  [mRNA]  locus=scaffold812:120991:121476:+ [translate_table: standard]